MRYIKSFSNDAAIQAAVDNMTLGKPYVALNDQTGKIDWNTKSDTPDYSKMYLTIEALEDGEIKFDKRLYYSINNGEWMEKSGIAYPTIAVSNGDKVRFKGSVSPDKGFFSTTKTRFNVYGNVESLKYGDNFIGKTDFLKMKAMFSNSNVVSAKNLIIPSPIVINPDDDAPFENMFYNCKQLIEAPALPATTLDAYSYRYVFYGCISLTTAPELPAATLASNCYNQMFYGCTNLNYVKCLATDISASDCLYRWLTSVSPTGTFVKKAGVTWPTGQSGIPSGWTRHDI